MANAAKYRPWSVSQVTTAAISWFMMLPEDIMKAEIIRDLK